MTELTVTTDQEDFGFHFAIMHQQRRTPEGLLLAQTRSVHNEYRN
jgi:hypothetical protein